MTQFFKAMRLDDALKSGKTPDPKLQGLVKTARQLEVLRSVPPLEKDDLNTAKAAFLSRANSMASQQKPTPIATERSFWLSKVKESMLINQRRAWVPVTAVIVLLLVFLSVFGFNTLNQASKASLPGNPLYTYKIVKEDLSASLTFDAYKKVMVYLEQIQERQEEIFSYAQRGEAPPPQTVSRLEKLFNAALKAAALLPDPEMQASLEEIKQASETMGETIAQAKPSVQDSENGALDQAESKTNDTLALVDQGLRDPDGFRVNMAAPKPVANDPTSTPSAKVVYPPIEPTPIVRWPTPTVGILNPPLTQPTPTCTCEPTQAVQEPILPSGTATQQELQPTATNTNPPPILPTPTELYMQPTQAQPTPTATQTPDSDLPIYFPTPTPMQMQDDGN
jgi:hypothetical protein